MKRLIYLFIFISGSIYAQDSLWVKINHMGQENFLYVADSSVLGEYLDDNFDTTAVDFSVEYAMQNDVLDDIKADAEELIYTKGKYRNKIFTLKLRYYEKVKKIKKSKMKKSKNKFKK